MKEFINEDSNRLNLFVEYAGGDPRLVFYDENDNESKIVDVSNMDRLEIIKTLEDHGFGEKKIENDDGF